MSGNILFALVMAFLAIFASATTYYANQKLLRMKHAYDKLDKKYYDKQLECAGLTCDIEAADRENSKLRMKLSELDIDNSDKDNIVYDKDLSVSEVQDERNKLQLELTKINRGLLLGFQKLTGVQVSSVYINIDQHPINLGGRTQVFGAVTHVDVDIEI